MLGPQRGPTGLGAGLPLILQVAARIYLSANTQQS